MHKMTSVRVTSLYDRKQNNCEKCKTISPNRNVHARQLGGIKVQLHALTPALHTTHSTSVHDQWNVK